MTRGLRWFHFAHSAGSIPSPIKQKRYKLNMKIFPRLRQKKSSYRAHIVFVFRARADCIFRFSNYPGVTADPQDNETSQAMEMFP